MAKHLPSIRDEMSNFFPGIEDIFSRGFLRPAAWSKDMTDWMKFPQLDVREHNGSYLVTAELPGINSKDVSVELDTGNILTIKGEKKQEKEEEGEGSYYSERRFGSFSRRVQLPGEVNRSKIEANQEKGVLTIRLPKADASSSTNIDIKTTEQ